MTDEFPPAALERLAHLASEFSERLDGLAGLLAETSIELGRLIPEPTPEPEPEDPPGNSEPPRPPVTGGDDSDLPTLELDVAHMVEHGTIKTVGQHFGHTDRGARIYVPETGGGPIPLRWGALRIHPNNTSLVGDTAHFVLTGPGARFVVEEGTGGLDLHASVPQRVTFELIGVNINAEATISANALNVAKPCTLLLRQCLVTGGRNGLAAANGPTDILIEDSEFARSGGVGSGKHHNVYAGLVRRMDVRGSQFHSPLAMAHAFKCYAMHLDMRDSLVAHYLEEELAELGFYGQLPPVDLGAWGDTILVDNTIERRGDKARPSAIEYRNRPYWPNVRDYDPPDWGHTDVPWQEVDNRDPSNPHLFRHILARNKILNSAEGGWAVRHEGTAPWETAEDVPAGWAARHDRAVVYMLDNDLAGKPFSRDVENSPYRREFIRTTAHIADAVPDWAQALIDQSAAEALG